MIAAHDRSATPPADVTAGSRPQLGEKKPAVSGLVRLLPLLRPHRGMVLLAVISLSAAALISLALPMAVRRMIDNGFGQSDDGFINSYFLMLLVLAIALAIASACRYYFVTTLGERIVSDLRVKTFRNVTRLPASFFDANKSGDIASRLTADAAQIKSALNLAASVALRNSLLCLGALVMMFVTSPGLSAITLGAIPLVVAPLVLFGRSVRRKSRAAQDALATASAFASEMIAGSRTVQAFNGEAAAAKRYADDVEMSYRSAVFAARSRALLTAVAIALIFGSVVGVLWIGAHNLLSGTLSAGSLSQFLLYSVIAAGSLGSLSEIWGELAQAAGSAERLFELLDEDAGEGEQVPRAALSQPAKGAVEIRDLHFAYPGAPDRQVLTGLSMSVRPGETVALVGASGSGKSSIFSLLLGFYNNYAGDISLDGCDVRSTASAAVRGEIAIVPQDVTIFATTIADNISLGRPDASQDEIVAAATTARAHGFISELPDGYRTVVGERGLTLSGGQRQRLAIARAILKNAPILLLDEATASLDAENEMLVQKGLDELMRNRTTIVIAHRLATVLKADRILVIDGGRVIEEGTHAALIRKGGAYCKLAELQFDLSGSAALQHDAA
ncbi:ABC transporter transmembrane domain-containing protein [Rhizobium mesosinicum]|uniref:ATP-binding cassette domain-containing protein n=1 Tax=Rhizobium mesosinicum TaxID=335017 RepID=A0ABS7GRG2_9HYPH|nr:ABC transporter transmembrane domain-containing protein [Rhizobium mesosinicum]MBW9052551.1 ATP-binding cassette domain-containing protein [Rhizobium mesosinicum]